MRGVVAPLILVAIVFASCGSDEGETRSTEPVVSTTVVSTIEPTDSTEATLPALTDSTIAAPSTSSSTPTPPSYPIELDGLTVAAPEPSFGHVVGVGDGFVRVATTSDGQTIVLTSDSGDRFTPIDSDLSLGLVAGLAADGDIIVAIGSDPTSTVPSAWVSADGGAHWSALPPMATPTGPAASEDGPPITVTSVAQGVAAMNGRVVVTVSETPMIDWEAYAQDVLGESHGPVRGVSSGGSTLTVTFADGAELTVDMADLGGADPATFMIGRPVVHAFDGAAWTRTEQPDWTTFDGTSEVVAGPAGFGMLVQEPMSSNGPGGPAFMLSTDGIGWTAHPVAGMRGTMGGTIGAGPHGYVIVTDRAILHSPDGSEWQEVHEIEDLEPTTSALPDARGVAGGPAGFAAVVLEHAGGGGSSAVARALWSADGRTWQTADITDPAVSGWATAVDDVRAAVVPEARLGPPRPALPASDDELIEGLAEGLDPMLRFQPDGPGTRDVPPLSESEAMCVANAIVTGIGADRIREQQPRTRDEAAVTVAAYRACTPNWKWLLAFGITEGSDWLSAETMTCVQDLLDDALAEALFIEEAWFDPDRDPVAHAKFHEPLIDALEQCATAQELNALDWN